MSGGPIFPPNPTVGQLYTYGTTTWQWNGTQWVNATAGQNFLPLAGGTMTGAIVLAGNAAANLNPVPLQQLNTSLGGYLPLAGGTVTGAVTANGGLTAGSPAVFGASNAGGVSANNLVVSGAITVNGAGITWGTSGLIGAGHAMAIGWDLNSNPGHPGVSLLVDATVDSGSWLVRSITQTGTYFAMLVIALAGSQTIMTGWHNGNSTVTWSTAPSDRRVKQNPASPPPLDALAAVNATPVYAADYVRGDHREHWDFTLMADEVQATLPFAYMAAPDEKGFASLHPLHLISTLWRAVQQLSAELTALKAPTGGTP